MRPEPVPPARPDKGRSAQLAVRGPAHSAPAPVCNLVVHRAGRDRRKAAADWAIARTAVVLVVVRTAAARTVLAPRAVAASYRADRIQVDRIQVDRIEVDRIEADHTQAGAFACRGRTAPAARRGRVRPPAPQSVRSHSLTRAPNLRNSFRKTNLRSGRAAGRIRWQGTMRESTCRVSSSLSVASYKGVHARSQMYFSRRQVILRPGGYSLN